MYAILDRRTGLTGGYGKVVSSLLLSLLFTCLKKLQVDDVDVVIPVSYWSGDVHVA